MKKVSEHGLYEPSTERANCGVGLVAQIDGRASHDVLTQALEVLKNLEHRGARGSDNATGDGAGVMSAIPDPLFRRVFQPRNGELPAAGGYGTGLVFFPQDEALRARCREIIEQTVAEEQADFLGFRIVPIHEAAASAGARANQPWIEQAFVGFTSEQRSGLPKETKLFVIRRLVEQRVVAELGTTTGFYIPSLSTKKIVYKGLLLAHQISDFYRDLQDEDFTTAFAVVHQRYSTNTFPSWPLAHPFRFLCHNGEINTLRGNLNWLRAREALLDCPTMGADLKKVLPLIPPGLSDSASLDAMLELLVQSGRSLPHAMSMLIPEAWEKHESMPQEQKDFYEFHSCLMEPWDGPALAVFTDGDKIGALLDRNGLRPARYLLTRSGRVILSSEAGTVEVPTSEVTARRRLEPGKMLLIDLERRRMLPDEEVKRELSSRKLYGQWLEQNQKKLADLPIGKLPFEFDRKGLIIRQRGFGYTNEEVNKLLGPMANQGEEAVGSMGSDIPLAVFSERSVLLYDYFKQLFAQVTNPPLDAIREEIVTSSRVLLGRELNLLTEGPEHAERLRLERPILSDAELASIKALDSTAFRALTLPTLFMVGKTTTAAERGESLRLALDELRNKASEAVRNGHQILVLSDHGVDAEHSGIPALLACSAVHHHLIRSGQRSHCSLVVESGEPREVHHMALLLGYGASAINPYLALDSGRTLHARGRLSEGTGLQDAERSLLSGFTKGVVKIMSKMGISCLQSYMGAQVFEAVGLSEGLISEYFSGTVSRIGGIGLEEIAEETTLRHHQGYPRNSEVRIAELDAGGDYQWRRQGERHQNSPATIAKLQHAVREGNPKTFAEYSALINQQSKVGNTLRGLLKFRTDRPSIPLNEVEPAAEVVKRFKTGAMSFGSLSFEAHANLAIAMNRIGGKSNSGEGGEDSMRNGERYENVDAMRAHIHEISPWIAAQLTEGDSLKSAIRQVASARFGVTSEYLAFAEEIQIKLAQGAKPGEGGQLPGHKVDGWIAAVRHSTPGVTLISPPPHHDIYSIEDLAQLIYDLRCSNPKARISVKLVSEVGVGTIAAGVAKAKADAILISGADGGTGASPLSSIKHAGLPWELGLAESHQVLVMNGLREFVTLETDGQLKTGRDVAIACLLGAEEFGFSTAPMIAQGCVMMRKCHLNTCPVGVATQDPELRKQFRGKPEHVINFMFFVAEELRAIMSELGFRSISEMAGKSDCLDTEESSPLWKGRGVDLSPMLYQSEKLRSFSGAVKQRFDIGLERSLEQEELLALVRPALDGTGKVFVRSPIRNGNRAVGAQIGYEVTRRFGSAGLPESDGIHLHFHGSAGQSFGAFLPYGLKFEIEGEVNDYCGKGLSGGLIAVYPPKEAHFRAHENVIAGNVAFYGATSGQGFISGRAGERFAVRNSGAEIVVEGIGEHGCEYMTGGKVLILGSIGRNFGAGMSGGIAFVHHDGSSVEKRCNGSMIELDDPSEAELEWIDGMLLRHVELTGSVLGQEIFDHHARFLKVVPKGYRAVLGEAREDKKLRANERR